jgi:two-component system, oxyanion-binding sensor
MTRVRIGYVPLTDAASLIVAQEKGFAASKGLSFELLRETAWAGLRDRLIMGQLDAAHMLAPLAAATQLGLGHIQSPLRILDVMSLNGNAVTVSSGLAERLDDPETSLVERAMRLVNLARVRKAAGKPLMLATVFRFSCHTLLLHRLFTLGGGRLSEDADLVVLPPSLMVEGLSRGIIDGFCAGSPWNMAAVTEAEGLVFALGTELLPDMPEKLLVVPQALGDSSLRAAMRRAMQAAGDWLTASANHPEAAAILARDTYLACAPELILSSLAGKISRRKGQQPVTVEGYLKLGPADLQAARGRLAARLAAEMHRAGQIASESDAVETIEAMLD